MKLTDLNWAMQQRMRFIDFLMHQYGHINRSAVMDYFGISQPCATRDMAIYQEIAPKNMVYDKKAKAYVRGLEFERVFP